MGCCNETTTVQRTHRPREVRERLPIKPPEKLAGEPIKGITDFYCEECGLTVLDAQDPYQHFCDPNRTRRGFVDIRRKSCALCRFNEDGVCLKVKEKYPDRMALVEIGTKISTARCPINRWLAVKLWCPNCNKRLCNSSGINSCECGWQGDPLLPITPLPFEKEPIRHLHFFLYPRYRESVDYHLDQLRQSIDLFNGRKILFVATGRSTLQQEYQDQFDELFDEVTLIANNRNRQEMVSWLRGFEMLESTDPCETICYAHGKGQKPATVASKAVRRWTEAMYEKTVRNWSGVREAFEDGYAMAGSFRTFKGPGKHDWHYSGSFYWCRSALFFGNPDWKTVRGNQYASETYPGDQFAHDQCACLYADRIRKGSLYQPEVWHD